MSKKRTVRLVKKPTETVVIGPWVCWCVVCQDQDMNHEHPDDPRAPRIGDKVRRATPQEQAWIDMEWKQKMAALRSRVGAF